jgi:plastocyanin
LVVCAAAAATTVVLLAAPGDRSSSADRSPYGAWPTADRPSADGESELVIQDFAYSTLTVAGGSDVSVVNRDSVPHTVTADDGSFTSSLVEGGGSASLAAPSTPGTYTFFCDLHPSMRGELVVS